MTNGCLWRWPPPQWPGWRRSCSPGADVPAAATGLLAFGAALVVLAAGLGFRGGLTLVRPARKLFGFTGGYTLTPEFCALLARPRRLYRHLHRRDRPRRHPLRPQGPVGGRAQPWACGTAAILRHIVLPQALRVILPAMTSQYVGIIKNSSLAVAIGYPDLFWAVSTAINVTGHAIEGVVVLMAGYLVLTLGTSGAMNRWYARL